MDKLSEFFERYKTAQLLMAELIVSEGSRADCVGAWGVVFWRAAVFGDDVAGPVSGPASVCGVVGGGPGWG